MRDKNGSERAREMTREKERQNKKTRNGENARRGESYGGKDERENMKEEGRPKVRLGQH